MRYRIVHLATRRAWLCTLAQVAYLERCGLVYYNGSETWYVKSGADLEAVDAAVRESAAWEAVRS